MTSITSVGNINITIGGPAGNNIGEKVDEINMRKGTFKDLVVTKTFNGDEVDGALVFTDSEQTLKNKTLDLETTTLKDENNNKIKLEFGTSTTDPVSTITSPDFSGPSCELVTTLAGQIIRNKTLDLLSTTMRNNAGNEVKLDLGASTTDPISAVIVPNFSGASCELISTSATQTLKNKILDSDTVFFQNEAGSKFNITSSNGDAEMLITGAGDNKFSIIVNAGNGGYRHMVFNDGVQTIKDKQFVTNNTVFVSSDNTKSFVNNLISNGRINFTIGDKDNTSGDPDTTQSTVYIPCPANTHDIELINNSSLQVLSNKVLDTNTTIFNNVGKRLKIKPRGDITLNLLDDGTQTFNNSITIPGSGSIDVVTTQAAQTLKNKTLDAETCHIGPINFAPQGTTPTTIALPANGRLTTMVDAESEQYISGKKRFMQAPTFENVTDAVYIPKLMTDNINNSYETVVVNVRDMSITKNNPWLQINNSKKLLVYMLSCRVVWNNTGGVGYFPFGFIDATFGVGNSETSIIRYEKKMSGIDMDIDIQVSPGVYSAENGVTANWRLYGDVMMQDATATVIIKLIG